MRPVVEWDDMSSPFDHTELERRNRFRQGCARLLLFPRTEQLHCDYVLTDM